MPEFGLPWHSRDKRLSRSAEVSSELLRVFWILRRLLWRFGVAAFLLSLSLAACTMGAAKVHAKASGSVQSRPLK